MDCSRKIKITGFRSTSRLSEGAGNRDGECKQLDGPCDLAHRGASADDVIKAQDRHLKDAVASGDTDHEAALKAMKGRWRHPMASMGWYKGVKACFADLPED